MTILGHIGHRQALAGWQHRADRVGAVGTARLDLLRRRAIELRGQVDRFVRASDARLAGAAPRPEVRGLPLGTDWVWRADPFARRVAAAGLAPVIPGAEFGVGARLFHDCPRYEIAVRQRRNPGAADLPPFALEVDVFGFAGSFLSLALDLPEAAAAGLGARHIVRLDLTAESEAAPDLYARLNLRHGPNTAQVLRQVPMGRGAQTVAFDLAAAGLGAQPVEAVWLDLILSRPAMNRTTFRDVVLSRHPRAAL